MNPDIGRFFDAIETRLIESPAVISYEIVRREIAPTDGKLRVKAVLCDGGALEFFEYVTESRGHVHLLKYSLHWQDSDGNLIRRWDNAPHHMQLPNRPHHVHYQDDSVRAASVVPDISSIMDQIEGSLLHSSRKLLD